MLQAVTVRVGTDKGRGPGLHASAVHRQLLRI